MSKYWTILGAAVVSWSCAAPEPSPSGGESTETAALSTALGIRANGDTEIAIDLSRIPEELKQVFDHIDKNLDQHVVNLQKWIQQPSISNWGEGIPESAQMGKGYFEQLGCQESRV